MSPKMGRPKTKDFSSEKFQELSREERQLRGRMSTLKRMIEKREGEIENLKPSIMKEVNKLMKPISRREKEIKDCREEIDQLKNKIQSLEFKDLTIQGISYECGFKSKASFYRVFKKETGLSPSEYIKSLK